MLLITVSFDRGRCLLHLLNGQDRKADPSRSSEMVGGRKLPTFVADEPDRGLKNVFLSDI